MAIYLNKLDTKLNAILSKDLDSIVAQKVYLPFMGKIYTKAELQTWLNKRIDLLNNIKINNYSDAQITNFIKNIRTTLSASDKLIADKVIANEDYTLTPSSADGYEKLVLIMLYKFVTTP
jgi:hypothetical protein